MKSQYPFLTKAPIIEAVLEIKTTPVLLWEEKVITDKVKSQFGTGYTFESENIFQHTMQFQPSLLATDKKSIMEWNGLRLTSEDTTGIVKVNRDSYVYSRLQPYPGWENFKERALIGWNDYRVIAGKQNIKRIGIRFINKIEFANDELSELFVGFPETVGKIDKSMSGYFQQNVYTFNKGEYGANHIQTIQASDINNENPSFILDIDVYTLEVLPLEEKDLNNILEQIRMFKNDIFFGAIKEKLLERLK
jgi:uncharacterized protein (TIGR04255 family)